MPTIETERTLMRPLSADDVSLLYSIDSLLEVKKYLGEMPLENLEQASSYVNHCLQLFVQTGLGWFIVFDKEHSRFLGICGLQLYREKFNNRSHFVALRYRFLPEFWGNGYATEVANSMISFRSQKVAFQEVICMVHPENKASKRVLSKIGFVFENSFEAVGELWEWHSLPIQ